jgi:hypothetical protein
VVELLISACREDGSVQIFPPQKMKRRQDKSRITSVEMKLMRRAVIYTWQDYKTNEYILSELKINPVVRKIQNYRNIRLQNVRRMGRDSLTQL